MKKLLSIILCVSMMFSFCGMFAFAEENLEFLVAGDFQYVPAPDALPHYNDDPLYHYALNTGGLFPESGAIIDSFLEDAKNDTAPFVLITGDLSNSGNASYHADIIEKLSAFEQETGKQVFVINGNHDTTVNYTKEQFKSDYADFGYNQALTVDDKTCSYTVDLNEQYRLIAIDSLVLSNNTYTGSVNDELMNWINEQGQKAKADKKYLIALTHYPIIDHIPLQSTFLKGYSLGDNKKLPLDFVSAGIKFVFSGHFHTTDIAQAIPAPDNRLYDILSGSLITADCPYKKVVVDSNNFNITTKHITSIDVSDISYLYTQEQLELITTNFPEYSKNFYKTGIKYFIKNYLTVNRLANVLQASPESELYTVIEALVDTLNYFYELPFYSDNPDDITVSTLAAEKGLTLPKSNYKNFLDIASDLVYNVNIGDENFGMGTKEYNTLLVATQTIVLYAANDVDSATIATAVSQLTSKLKISIPTELIQGLLSNKENSLKNIVNLVFSIGIDSFLVDQKPADNNVSIKNSYVYKLNYKSTIFERMIEFFNKFIRFLRSLFAGKA